MESEEAADGQQEKLGKSSTSCSAEVIQDFVDQSEEQEGGSSGPDQNGSRSWFRGSEPDPVQIWFDGRRCRLSRAKNISV